MLVAETFWNRLQKAAGDVRDSTLAKRIGVSRSTIHRWKKGTDPDPEQLMKLEKAFGLPPNHWLGTNTATIPARFITEAAEEALIKQLRRDEQLESAVRALVRLWRFPDETT